MPRGLVGGGGVGAGGTLNFVCYIGWALASNVYPQKYTVYQPHTKKKKKKNIRHINISHTKKKYLQILAFFFTKSVVFIYFSCTMIILVI